MTVILFMKCGNKPHKYHHVKAVHQTEMDVYILLENGSDITVKTPYLDYILVLSD